MQRHTQIPCFRLFQRRCHLWHSSKVFGVSIHFLSNNIPSYNCKKLHSKIIDFTLPSQAKAASHKKCKDTLKLLVSASFRLDVMLGTAQKLWCKNSILKWFWQKVLHQIILKICPPLKNYLTLCSSQRPRKHQTKNADTLKFLVSASFR